MASKIEIVQELAVTRSDTVKMKTMNNFVQNVGPLDDDFNVIVQPGDVTLSIPSSTLESLDGELIHLKFTGVVNVTPIDSAIAQPIFTTCFAESNINWYWKHGLTQPNNRVEAVATVTYSEYARYMNKGDNLVILMDMDVDLGATPPEQIVRAGYGPKY